ncbi:MAG: hypothetical protein Q9195_000469 [Heterodermia aff. obscurata]
MEIKTDDYLTVFLTKLPENAKRSLPMILAPMENYRALSARLFDNDDGIDLFNTADAKRSFRDRPREMDVPINGQPQQDQILGTLTSCNDVLLTIASPAPDTSVDLPGEYQTFETSDKPQYNPQQEQASWDTCRTTASLFSNKHAEFASYNKSNLDGLTRPVHRAMIELLHSTCLKVIRSLVKQNPEYDIVFHPLGNRIAIWGSSLFSGQVSLDQALSATSTASQMLRNNIAGTLADIAFILTAVDTNGIAKAHLCSSLGEPDNSPSILQLRALIAVSKTSILPLNTRPPKSEPPSLEALSKNLAALIEHPFSLLSAIEMGLEDALLSFGHEWT